MAYHGVRKYLGIREIDSLRGPVRFLQRAQDRFLGLFAESLDFANPPGKHRLPQVLDGADAELPVQDLGALRAQPWYVQEIAQSRWDLRVKLGAQRQVPRFNDGADLARQILSYAGQVLDLVRVSGQIGQRLRMVTDHAGCVAVRSNAERVGPLDLQEVGYLIEDLRYLRILHNYSNFGLRIADCGF